MPVFVNSSRSRNNRDRTALSPRVNGTLGSPSRKGSELTIGLINNMGDGAFRATERQFISLLDAASDDISVRLELYTLPGVSRAGAGLHHAENFYSSAESISRAHLDGLIVTGREPIAADLRDEPYWNAFAEIVDWASENTYSTVWSCLAAHAAVLHLDGIGRSKSADKHFGVLECTRASDDPLLAGAPSTFPVPHSRWNGVPEKELIASGYTLLSRTAGGDVDAFVKRVNSLFVFFQGHPEYGADTLLREYRRDVGRYMRSESADYPSIPSGYFDDSTAKAMAELREVALREKATGVRSKQLVSSVAAAFNRLEIENTWRPTAALIYRNWLEYILARKQSAQLDRGARPVIVAAR